jgi:hypothetical protein
MLPLRIPLLLLLLVLPHLQKGLLFALLLLLPPLVVYEGLLHLLCRFVYGVFFCQDTIAWLLLLLLLVVVL